jgi:hypothetical protein
MDTTSRRNIAAEHADDAGTAAYRAARQMGATPEAARRAYDSAYAAALVSA